MANYYISDLHLGHKNIIRFDGRPFIDAEEMQNTLIENWNNTIKRDDIVYVLGDFIWDKEQNWPSYLEKFRGNKVLIKGNHDPKYFSTTTKRYFMDIKDYKEITDEGRHVILCHYPMPFHKAAYNPDCYMLYGHVHVTREQDYMTRLRKEIRESRTQSGDNCGNWYNVGCMMPWMNYTPRTLNEIIEGESYD